MVGIYNPFYVYFPNVVAITDAINTFNTTAKATGDYFKHATFVDINALSVGQYKTLSQQQRLKKQSTEDDIAVVEKSQLEKSKFDTKEKNNYLSDADHFHPNDKGYDMMADKIFKAMDRARIFK
ncbi:lysophospholipase L1 esterase domain protein [Pediococcus pentosaceus IE-3]|nr:lysophospholipase L1 esterase domain protein [Pediococcus pentosaceus IE-3]